MKNKNKRIIVYLLIGLQCIGYFNIIVRGTLSEAVYNVPSFIGTNLFLIIALIILTIDKRKKKELIIDDNTQTLCKYCRSTIDSKAKVCPYCRKEQKNFHIWKVAIGVIIGCFIMFCMFLKQIRTGDLYDNQIGTYEETNKDYITLTQFEKVENGMTLQEVKDIVSCELTIMSDTQISDENYQIYYCYGKDGISNANFSFENDKLVNKTQLGLK